MCRGQRLATTFWVQSMFIAVKQEHCEAIVADGFKAGKRGWVPVARSKEDAVAAFRRFNPGGDSPESNQEIDKEFSEKGICSKK